jgi:hypothetical protein
MRHFIRRPHFLIAGLLAAAAACSDSDTISAPDGGATTLDHKSSAAGDTAHTGSPTAPHTPSTPGDTASAVPPSTPSTPSAPHDSTPSTPPFVPAASINLTVTVGAAVSGTDTLAFSPLANARVTVFAMTLVAAPGGGRDSLTVSEHSVADATTDASGKVRFAGLPAVAYRIEAVREGGSASVRLAAPYPADVDIKLIIR